MIYLQSEEHLLILIALHNCNDADAPSANEYAQPKIAQVSSCPGHICAHKGFKTWPGEPHENGEMNEMILPSK